jgi:hypothetical protein
MLGAQAAQVAAKQALASRKYNGKAAELTVSAY